jgi:hypothetical protein
MSDNFRGDDQMTEQQFDVGMVRWEAAKAVPHDALIRLSMNMNVAQVISCAATMNLA